MALINVNISKGDNYDRDGTILKNFISNLDNTENYISIIDRTPSSYYMATLENASKLFDSRYNVQYIDLEYLNLSTVTDAGYMFNKCWKLININGLYNNIYPTRTTGMFANCRSLTSIPNFDTSKVTDMLFMFSGCNNLTSIPNFDTSNAKDMEFIFYNCYNLKSVPNFNTAKVTNMQCMFYRCNNLTTVPNFNTINVTNMSDMFQNCIRLTTIPNFNTKKVTNMDSMFYYCTNLTTVSNFDTSNVKDMAHMFYDCFNLTSVPNFNTKNVTNMYYMFGTCPNLTSVPNFDTGNVKDMGYMFDGCRNLHVIPSYNCDNITCIANAFGSHNGWGGTYKTSFGPLVNLGKAFTGIPANNAKTTLDLYWVTDTNSAPVVSATSQLYNISTQNSQQIIIMGETYSNMTAAQRSAITNKGWLLIQMGNVCLTGDMKIQTPNGLIKIKDLKNGDKVYIHNKETNTQYLTVISKTVNHKNLQIYTFTLSNGEYIKCTARHQFLVNSSHFSEHNEETNEYVTITKQDYMEARLIDKTDKFITSEGNEIEITDINISDEEQLVYEINTEIGDNYLLGKDSIIVKQEEIES